jgi:hypothetical protein
MGGGAPADFGLQSTCGITVTNASDSGPGSLRQAIADACPGGRITFAADTTIYLVSTLEITRRLTIDGEAHAITISGDSGGDGTPNVQVFIIPSSGVVTLSHLSIVSGTAGHDGYGGGIANGGMLTLQNSTLAGNSAGDRGGGIYNDDPSALNLSNTLIAHSLSGGDCRNVAGGAIANDHNLMRSGLITDTCGITDGVGGSRIGVDPLLGPLANNGSPCPTHALLPGSPAIDAGNNATCMATDQRGVARPQGAACDIGAIESTGR